MNNYFRGGWCKATQQTETHGGGRLFWHVGLIHLYKIQCWQSHCFCIKNDIKAVDLGIILVSYFPPFHKNPCRWKLCSAMRNFGNCGAKKLWKSRLCGGPRTKISGRKGYNSASRKIILWKLPPLMIKPVVSLVERRCKSKTDVESEGPRSSQGVQSVTSSQGNSALSNHNKRSAHHWSFTKFYVCY